MSQIIGDDAPIQIVNQQDQPIGTASIPEARQKGLIHRIVWVMVEDEDGRILLQRRSSKMETYPNCWDASAGGHVDAGESYDEAAERELREEIGITGFKPVEKAYFPSNSTYKEFKLNRFNKIYQVVVPSNIPTTLQEDEVSEVRWFNLEEVRQLMAGDAIAGGLKNCFKHLYQ